MAFLFSLQYLVMLQLKDYKKKKYEISAGQWNYLYKKGMGCRIRFLSVSILNAIDVFCPSFSLYVGFMI